MLTSIEVPVFHIRCCRVASQDSHDALGGLLNSLHSKTKVFSTVSLQHTREIVVKPLLVWVDGHQVATVNDLGIDINRKLNLI